MTPKQRLDAVLALQARTDDADVQYLIKYWMSREVLRWHGGVDGKTYIVDQDGYVLLRIWEENGTWDVLHEFPQGGLPEYLTKESAINAALALAQENGYLVTGTP
jgi:hypothetical protein